MQKCNSSSCYAMEGEKLRSRIDQQSSLICMLKQRADTTLKELSDMTCQYQTVNKQLQLLQESLAGETKQRQLVEQRFHILCNNHQEMIKLKDEYKEKMKQLMERRKSKEEEEKEREKVVMKKRCEESEEKVVIIEKEWQEKMKGVVAEVEEARGRAETAEREREEFAKRFEGSARKHEAELLVLQERLSGADNENASIKKALTLKCKEVKELRMEIFSLQEELTHSNTDLQVHTEKVSFLEQELEAAKIREKEMTEKWSKDASIQRFKMELEKCQQKLLSVEKEYAAFKTHSAELLAYERELNQQLRHLIE